MRQLARGHRALTHQIVVGAMFLDDLAGEYKWIGSGENIAGAPEPKSRHAHHVIERPHLGPNVVIAVTSLDVLVVRPAVQNHVTL